MQSCRNFSVWVFFGHCYHIIIGKSRLNNTLVKLEFPNNKDSLLILHMQIVQHENRKMFEWKTSIILIVVSVEIQVEAADWPES